MTERLADRALARELKEAQAEIMRLKLRIEFLEHLRELAWAEAAKEEPHVAPEA